MLPIVAMTSRDQRHDHDNKRQASEKDPPAVSDRPPRNKTTEKDSIPSSRPLIQEIVPLSGAEP